MLRSTRFLFFFFPHGNVICSQAMILMSENFVTYRLLIDYTLMSLISWMRYA